MKAKRSSNFVIQGSLLAMAGIIVRLIGMLYRIPLTAIIGDEGNGYYTSAFSIYTLLLILSSFSMPLAISKIVSADLSKGRYRNIEKVLRAAFIYATIIGFLMFSLLYFKAEAIADLLKKPYCCYALKALAPTVWIMAYLGILRGYFQGTGNMIPTAISQILEQIVNAVISVLAAYILFAKGEKSNVFYGNDAFSPAFGAAGGAIGTGAGALTALIFFMLIYRAQKSYLKRKARLTKDSYTDSYRNIVIILAATMLPILFSSTVYNISSVIDDYIYGNMMTYLGSSANIVRDWGIFGEYHILFNIPVALSNALSSSLIPSLTGAVEEHDDFKVIKRLNYAIRFTMLIAIPASVGLFALADPVSRMLFPGKHVGLLISLTRTGSAAVAFFSLSTITNAVLQGLGYLSEPLRNALKALVIHIIALIAMLYFGLGIYSVVLSNIVFAFIMCILNARSIFKYTSYRTDILAIYVKPFIASAIMGASSFATYKFIFSFLPNEMRTGRLGSCIEIMPALVIALIVYFISLKLMHALTKEDLENMPFGRKLGRLFFRR